jgi:hypothetical protein
MTDEVTLSMIEEILQKFKVLRMRDLRGEAVRQALKEMWRDNEFYYVVSIGESESLKEYINDCD